MAQRIDALMFRLGKNTIWSSQWYSKKGLKHLVAEDCMVTIYLMRSFPNIKTNNCNSFLLSQ